MMIERGYKSDDFDSQCRYVLTDEGEMVLYDFGMHRRLLIFSIIPESMSRSEPSFRKVLFLWDLPEQVRHFLPRQSQVKLMFLSFRLRGLILLRCMSVSVHQESGICSRMRRRTLLVSYS